MIRPRTMQKHLNRYFTKKAKLLLSDFEVVKIKDSFAANSVFLKRHIHDSLSLWIVLYITSKDNVILCLGWSQNGFPDGIRRLRPTESFSDVLLTGYCSEWSRATFVFDFNLIFEGYPRHWRLPIDYKENEYWFGPQTLTEDQVFPAIESLGDGAILAIEKYIIPYFDLFLAYRNRACGSEQSLEETDL